MLPKDSSKQRIEIFASIINADLPAFLAAYAKLENPNILNDEGINILQQIIAFRAFLLKQSKPSKAKAIQTKRDNLLKMFNHVLATQTAIPLNINLQTVNAKTALHFAVDLGDAEATDFLLKHNADLNSLDDRRFSPIVLISLLNDKTFQDLLKMGIPLSSRSFYLIAKARIEKKDIQTLNLLWARLPNVNLNLEEQKNLILICLSAGKVCDQYAKQLIDLIPEQNTSFQNLYNDLLLSKNAQLLSAMLKKNIPMEQAQLYYALGLAINNKDFALFQQIMAYYDKAPLTDEQLRGLIAVTIQPNNALDNFGFALIAKLPEGDVQAQTLYWNCVHHDNASLLHHLLAKKIPLPINEWGLTVYDVALMHNREQCILSPDLFRLDVYTLNAWHETALHRAIRLEHTEYVHYLIDMNEKIKQNRPSLFTYQETTSENKTLLHHAATSNPDILKMILNLIPPINLEQQDNSGKTALDYAIENKRLDLAEILINAKAKINPAYQELYTQLTNEHKATEAMATITISPLPEKKGRKKKTKQLAAEQSETKREVNESKEAAVPPDSPTSAAIERGKFQKQTVSKKVRMGWAQMLYLMQDNEIKHVPWAKWIGPKAKDDKSQELLTLLHKSHPELVRLNDLLSKALRARNYEDEEGRIRFHKHDGVYLVGSEGLNVLFRHKIKVPTNDADLMIVGLTVNEVLQVLAANQINYVHQIGGGKQSIKVKFNDNDVKEIDITCIESAELYDNMNKRLFTISGIVINLSNTEIVAAGNWLKDATQIKPVICCIDKDPAAEDIDKNPAAEIFADFIAKIRAVALYAKLESLGVTFAPTTETALKDETSNFTKFAEGRTDNPTNKLIRILNTKIFDTAGIVHGYELLKQCNMLKQIQIPKEQIPSLFLRDYGFPKLLDEKTEEFKTNFEILLKTIRTASDLSLWQAEHRDRISAVIEAIDSSEPKSVIRNHGMRFMTCLFVAGVDFAPILNLSETKEAVFDPD